MLKNKYIAFYAPIKPPDHPIPSGDRLIAQNLVKAFKILGANIELASGYIAYSKRYDEAILIERKSGALEEADKLIKTYLSKPIAYRPQLWITYHPYCKAPDWIGPIVCNALKIPYITIEAAKTGQGGEEDNWRLWREEAQSGIIKADRHLVFKPTDREYLSELLNSTQKLRSLTPFIDAENMQLAEPTPLPAHWHKQTPVLITTGMMRKGKKEQNFQILSQALKDLPEDFNLIIVGGGPEEEAIRFAFSHIDGTRVYWTGSIEHSEVLRWMRTSDIFIWPGWKEPIGMVYLEAQLQELPIIAYKSMGVPLVVKDNKTGLLAPEAEIDSFRSNIRRLLKDKSMRQTMGINGRQKVLSQHGIIAASKSLNTHLSDLIN